jgi:3-dehydroquinate synthase
LNTFYIESSEFKFEDDKSTVITVKSNIKKYTVYLDNNNSIETTLKLSYENENIVFLDSKVYSLYFEQINGIIPPKDIFLVHAKEENKTIETALKAIEFLNFKKFHKKNKIIVIGGGITQDVGSFVAACFKRGIDWTFIPTTLLAQCDSCIGSKSGLNYNNVKNQIGLFAPPSSIIINTEFLKTLTHEEIKSGLGEILKVYLMAGNKFFKHYTDNVSSSTFEGVNSWKTLILKSLLIKKQIIEFDEFERDTRRALNYGHTVGHAIETLTDYKIPHGQAVALGIYVSNEINNTNTYEMKSQLLSLITNKNELKNIDYAIMKNILISDKKSIGEDVMMVFVNPSKSCSHLSYINVNILIEKIKEAIGKIL